MDRLHNCPNCGGYLNDRGRCAFCGSKVYDFCDIDLSFDVTKPPKKTYLRLKTAQGIWTVPVIAQTCGVTTPSCEDTILGVSSTYMSCPAYPEIELNFLAVGEGTYEKENDNDTH